MSAVVRTDGLTKRFGALAAVDEVSLEVHRGDLFGFLGPNGSGKTTTLRMILGLMFPTGGSIEVLGRPVPRKVREVLPRIGALVEGPGFYPHLSARSNLALFDAAGPGGAKRTRHARIDDALERVGLAGVGRKPFKAFSTGMQQRLGLASALLRPHELLILDEPTNGLDPQGMRDIRALLVELVAQGTTIVLSSHLLGEIESICTRAAIVHRGRLLAQDEIPTLLAPTGRVRIVTEDAAQAERVLGHSNGFHSVTRDRSGLALQLGGASPEELNRRLVTNGIDVRELIVERPTLEDVFLKLTAGGPRVPG
ncbi:MAG: ABC transporter ATP-binding protein [Actinomycetota bacterium]|nr:ABC transporter ATP-binding protein [Actinomycetota bacterium]